MMKRPLLASIAAFALVCAAAVTVGLYAQHSFPVRFDDEEPDRVAAAATTAAGVAVTDVLRLPPRDQPPFDCTTSTLGSIYFQNDVCDELTAFDTVLCVCSDQSGGVDWYFPGSGTKCSLAYDCP